MALNSQVSFTWVGHGTWRSRSAKGKELVIEFENGYTIYFAGDTDVFGDMAIIAELNKLDAAFLPIGDFYTMGPERAAKAVKLLGVKTIVPMHFGTFPALHGRPSQLQELVGKEYHVLDIKPGDTI